MSVKIDIEVIDPDSSLPRIIKIEVEDNKGTDSEQVYSSLLLSILKKVFSKDIITAMEDMGVSEADGFSTYKTMMDGFGYVNSDKDNKND